MNRMNNWRGMVGHGRKSGNRDSRHIRGSAFKEWEIK